MIIFEKEKCSRCGLCMRDCLGGTIVRDEAGYPTIPKPEFCIDCGHCYAICPQGAVNFHGRSAEGTFNSPLPLPEQMEALLKQRRSCRFYKPDPIAPEKMKKLKEILHYSPTGCNDHRLIFSIAEDPAEMEAVRSLVSKRLKTFIKTGIPGLILPASKRYFSLIDEGYDVIFRGAPHFVLVSTPSFAPCSGWDAKIALSYFDTYAQSLGLGTCWCGFGVWAYRLIPSLRRKLKLPFFYKVDAMMLFGEPAVTYQRPTAPEPMRIDPIRFKA